MRSVRAIVLTGYGLNCDYETHHSLIQAGAQSHRIHINELIGTGVRGETVSLEDFHILVFGGGFSWGDDHGAGVLMASKIRNHLGEAIERFIAKGKLIIGICNGFQALVNLGLLPALDQHYRERRVALTANDAGNFIDTWVHLAVNPTSHCVFTRGIETLELPVRHGEGKFYASTETLQRLFSEQQVVMQYADESGRPAEGRWPQNPNGSLGDIAGICDPTGRIFGLMPHPEAYNHLTNHPEWTFMVERRRREGAPLPSLEGQGIRIFQNAVQYIRETF